MLPTTTREKKARDARFSTKDYWDYAMSIVPPDAVGADMTKLAPHNSFSPKVWYRDEAFTCKDCGSRENLAGSGAAMVVRSREGADQFPGQPMPVLSTGLAREEWQVEPRHKTNVKDGAATPGRGPICTRGATAAPGPNREEKHTLMKLQVKPIYGWGWYDAKSDALDVPSSP
jgi:hypothetical protein